MLHTILLSRPLFKQQEEVLVVLAGEGEQDLALVLGQEEVLVECREEVEFQAEVEVLAEEAVVVLPTQN